MSERYLRPEEIARAVGVTPRYVRAVCSRRFGNTVSCIDVGEGKRRVYKIKLSEFENFLEREEEERLKRA